LLSSDRYTLQSSLFVTPVGKLPPSLSLSLSIVCKQASFHCSIVGGSHFVITAELFVEIRKFLPPLLPTLSSLCAAPQIIVVIIVVCAHMHYY
jgi:hypothetical protein